MKKIICSVSLLSLCLFCKAQVTSGLVAKYSFKNGSTTDTTGNNLGNAVGTTSCPDRFGNAKNAMYFSGNNSYISCGSSSSIEAIKTEFTISVWVKPDTINTGSWQGIISKWGLTFNEDHFLLGYQSNKIIYATHGPGDIGVMINSTMNVGSWNHVLFSWDSTGTHRIYLNDSLVENNKLTPHIMNVLSPFGLYIGSQSPTNKFFKGAIDDVRIYNRVLNRDEIDSIYNEKNPVNVGIKEKMNVSEHIILSPNPVKNIVNFSAYTNVEIYNMLGQKVYEKNNCNVIDISELPTGTYNIALRTEGKNKVEKIIKQ